MPSQAEGLSMTGLQAKANGLALVLSRTSGNLELVNSPEEGFLVTPGDTAGYVAALRSLLTEPDRLQAIRRASLASAGRFELQSIVDRYETVFKSVLA
jgi:glycosyltransferase involved in cell wall biosynthesis